ncbi:MAG: hypothetical protein WCG06_06265, partial [Candidatus Omnitrophota bacterium]
LLNMAKLRAGLLPGEDPLAGLTAEAAALKSAMMSGIEGDQPITAENLKPVLLGRALSHFGRAFPVAPRFVRSAAERATVGNNLGFNDSADHSTILNDARVNMVAAQLGGVQASMLSAEQIALLMEMENALRVVLAHESVHANGNGSEAAAYAAAVDEAVRVGVADWKIRLLMARRDLEASRESRAEQDLALLQILDGSRTNKPISASEFVNNVLNSKLYLLGTPADEDMELPGVTTLTEESLAGLPKVGSFGHHLILVRLGENKGKAQALLSALMARGYRVALFTDKDKDGGKGIRRIYGLAGLMAALGDQFNELSQQYGVVNPGKNEYRISDYLTGEFSEILDQMLALESVRTAA